MDRTNPVTINEEEVLEKLITQLPKDKYTRIYTAGRGGLSIAQAIAYQLDIKQVYILQKGETIPNYWDSESLFVDDIMHTGRIPIGIKCDTAVLVWGVSSNFMPTFKGITSKHEQYIKFSWEK